LSLPYLDQTHWTVAAAFTMSLTAGLLSVYFACMVQVQLGGLHSSHEVRRWLVTQRTARRHLSRSLARRHREHLESQAQNMESRLERLLSKQASGELADLLLEVHTQHIPSLYSALLLVAPLQLLNWSLAALLVGVGIYYGLVYTNALGEMRGAHANLALLVVYTAFTAVALASFVTPSLLKFSETADWAKQNTDRLEELLRQTPDPANVRRDELPSSGTGTHHHFFKPGDQHAVSGPVTPQAPSRSDNGDPAQCPSYTSPSCTSAKDDGGTTTHAFATMKAGGEGRVVTSVNLTRGRVLVTDDINLSSFEGVTRSIKILYGRVVGS
jgi:hypothetical protein